MALSRLLFIALSSTLILQIKLISSQNFLHNFCYDNITRNTYEANLNFLLSSISNNITRNNIRSYNITVGKVPDTVFGLFQCRGDISPEDCKKCAKTATTDIKVRCPHKQEITIHYDECWMRYSNKLIISVMDSDPKKYFSNPRNVGNPDEFGLKLNELMGGLVDRAVNNSTDMFGIGEVKVTDSETIYGLVQCAHDQTSRNCGRCLTTSVTQIPSCCDHKDGGRILKPSCILRFEVYKFYESDRVPAMILDDIPTVKEKSSKAVIILIVVLSVVLLLSIIFIIFYIRKNKRLEIAKRGDQNQIPTLQSLRFSFATVMAATSNFSDANKLGEGGFGSVYKGTLSDLREVAVKRLSRSSSQGVEQFKNEVVLLAKLRHRNLVRLLGFCLEGNEKLLIYEYVPNESLDKFIFDTIKRTYLDWEKRYNIIGGIARGLLYLHEDSRDRIIHRDLKAGNILLDAQMTPKISDFGLAKLFVVDQTQGITNKIVGTHGYMPPEYLLHGHFSVKSDVFSFGVLVLEIITGEKNNSFHQAEHTQNLLSYAWKKWKVETALELVEPALRDRYSRSEVMKCIQIGLLCVQEDVVKRPTMASVVLMLYSDSFDLPIPSAPAFFSNPTMDFNIIREEGQTDTTDLSQSTVIEKSITEVYLR